MGNEHSQMSGIEIDNKAVEVSDFWTQHKAIVNNNIDNISSLSIFISDLFINEAFWAPQNPLEKFTKNLMIYRHPCIVRYISSWQKANKYYLAVEEVTPLGHILKNMSKIEKCLGLYSILKALCFLHEKAGVSHNNLCLGSIFVSKDGTWKLGGMEFLCRYKTLSLDYLQKSRSHRYSKGVDSNEDKNLKQSNEAKDFIDTFAFCTLVNDLFNDQNDDDVPNLSSFKIFCKNVIQEPDILKRSKLFSLLNHDFFKHKFIYIHSYLIELPLKNDTEKMEFFTSLKEELEMLDEKLVAVHLGRLLVSRLILLNKTARNHLLPYIMIPKNIETENGALFSEEVFKEHIAPKLLNIFSVHDAQIRLLLLEYFPHFLHCFSKEVLQSQILPELLVGIKDTSNEVVSATLRTLAELVPVLGADVVIGGKRAKLFADGRPNSENASFKRSSKHLSNNITNNSSKIIIPLSTRTIQIENQNHLPERPRPDGEEGETSADEIEQSVDEEELDNWEAWETENLTSIQNNEENTESSENLEPIPSETISLVNSKSAGSIINKSKKIRDIEELDIKNQTKILMEQNDIDFFEDMEPIIETNTKFLIKKNEAILPVSNKLTVNIADINEDGWGDDWE